MTTQSTDTVKAGCGVAVTDEQVDAIASEVHELINDPIDFAFTLGYVAGLSFPTVPEEAETHGISAIEFASNALGYARQHIIESLVESPGVIAVAVKHEETSDQESGDSK